MFPYIDTWRSDMCDRIPERLGSDMPDTDTETTCQSSSLRLSGMRAILQRTAVKAIPTNMIPPTSDAVLHIDEVTKRFLTNLDSGIPCRVMVSRSMYLCNPATLPCHVHQAHKNDSNSRSDDMHNDVGEPFNNQLSLVPLDQVLFSRSVWYCWRKSRIQVVSLIQTRTDLFHRSAPFRGSTPARRSNHNSVPRCLKSSDHSSA